MTSDEPPKTSPLSESELPPPAPSSATEVEPGSDADRTRTHAPAAVTTQLGGDVNLAAHGFEVVRMLGEGAFARVYLARQVSLDRLVALKVALNFG